MKAYTTPAGNSPAAVADLRQRILATGGRIFRISFISRGKNEPRHMLSRLKRTGRERVDSDKWNSQITVFDVEKRAYRCIPLERCVFFRCGSEEWLTEV